MLEKFCCAKKDETDFLCNDALNQQKLRVNKTYLLFKKDDKLKILSYITLGVGAIEVSGERTLRGVRVKDKRLPRHIPCMLIGKLATDKNEENNHYASYLLSFATLQGLDKSEETPFPFIALHAYPEAVSLYKRNGFEIAYHFQRKTKTIPMCSVN